MPFLLNYDDLKIVGGKDFNREEFRRIKSRKKECATTINNNALRLSASERNLLGQRRRRSRSEGGEKNVGVEARLRKTDKQ